MIVSHKHKFIFIKTRKTAGTSVEILLSSICGENDIITPISPDDEEKRKQLGFRGAQNYKVQKKFYSRFEWYGKGLITNEKVFKNHLTARQVRNWLDKDVWNEYYKFSLERNPFDKVVSLYNYLGGDKRFESISNFILSGKMHGCTDFDHYTYGGIPVLDEIFKFENLNDLIQRLEKRLELKFSLDIKDLKTKSRYRNKQQSYQDVLSKEDRMAIEMAFAREIKYFGYSF